MILCNDIATRCVLCIHCIPVWPILVRFPFSLSKRNVFDQWSWIVLLKNFSFSTIIWHSSSIKNHITAFNTKLWANQKVTNHGTSKSWPVKCIFVSLWQSSFCLSQLTSAHLLQSKLNNIWIRKDMIYGTLVKSVLTYNSGHVGIDLKIRR